MNSILNWSAAAPFHHRIKRRGTTVQHSIILGHQKSQCSMSSRVSEWASSVGQANEWKVRASERTDERMVQSRFQAVLAHRVRYIWNQGNEFICSRGHLAFRAFRLECSKASWEVWQIERDFVRYARNQMALWMISQKSPLLRMIHTRRLPTRLLARTPHLLTACSARVRHCACSFAVLFASSSS